MTEKKTLLLSLKATLKLVTVEPFLFFCLFGYSVRLVSFQSLLMDKACRDIYEYPDAICKDLDNHEDQRTECIETGNNLYMGVMFLSSMPAIVVAVFLGPWSDKYSRKYPMIFASSGMCLEALTTFVLALFPSVKSIWYVVSALFAGVTGGFIISLSSAFSYLSDVTDDRSRPSRFAIVEFFCIAAIIAGNLVGGQIFKKYGYLPVMGISPFCFAAAVVYSIFLLAETKPKVPDDKRKEMFRDLFRIDNVKQSYTTCSRKRPGNIRLQIWLLVWISCSQRFADMGILAAGFPFAREMYKWDVTDFSNASIAFYIVNAAVTLIVLPIFSNKLRLHEAAIGLIGIISVISKMAVTSVAYKDFMFYFAWMSGTLGNGAGIAVRSRLSKLVGKEELGRAFSLLGTCESVTPLLGSVIFLQIYNSTARFFPGFAFAVAAVFLIPSAIIFTWMTKMPTVSLTEYAAGEELKRATPLENLASTNYNRLQEIEVY